MGGRFKCRKAPKTCCAKLFLQCGMSRSGDDGGKCLRKAVERGERNCRSGEARVTDKVSNQGRRHKRGIDGKKNDILSCRGSKRGTNPSQRAEVYFVIRKDRCKRLQPGPALRPGTRDADRQAYTIEDPNRSRDQRRTSEFKQSFIGSHAAGFPPGEDETNRIRVALRARQGQRPVSSRNLMMDLIPSSKFLR